MVKSYTDRSLSLKIKDLKIDEVQTITIIPQNIFPKVASNRSFNKDETGEIDYVFLIVTEVYKKDITNWKRNYY